jgi:hypothetical protein
MTKLNIVKNAGSRITFMKYITTHILASDVCLGGVAVSVDRTNPRRLSVRLGEVLRAGINSGDITCGRGPDANLQQLCSGTVSICLWTVHPNLQFSP